ncbi:hypothetical protein L228DRAFT_43924 [Xylona heveae TC161]|uniref:Uncharacterized protein n=1 Tax=Xylona heveae (strain CBS 132557 / TC161) TaxID=1328760 RepID=A0A164ZSW4_XYLHT|nr:hypothetical protein L228DRAFT_43924 [Xylona heveae TC161]KZF19468.1 hypothetical protein L228DRAFT_43924 [Xylona heveae TC161]
MLGSVRLVYRLTILFLLSFSSYSSGFFVLFLPYLVTSFLSYFTCLFRLVFPVLFDASFFPSFMAISSRSGESQGWRHLTYTPVCLSVMSVLSSPRLPCHILVWPVICPTVGM